MNDNRIFFSTRNPALRHFIRGALGVVSSLVAASAHADAVPPYTPPSTATHYSGFPSEQALRNQGYNPQTGTLKVNTTPNGRPVVTSNGTTVTGTQNVRTTATGNYGEKAVINSSVTQSVAGSTLNRLIGIAWVASGISNGIQHNNGRTQAAIASGNYGKAAVEASKSIGYGADSMFGGFLNMGANAISNGKATSAAATAQEVWDSVLGGGGSAATGGGGGGSTEQGGGISSNAPGQGSAHGGSQGGQMTADTLRNVANAAKNAQTDAIKKSDVGGAIAAASVAKAAEAAAQDAALASKKDTDVVWILYLSTANGSMNEAVFYTDKDPGSAAGVASYTNGRLVSYRYPTYQYNSYFPSTISDKSVSAAFLGWKKETFEHYRNAQAAKAPERYTMQSNEIADLLRQMLANQQANHAQLMGQLAKIPMPGSENLPSLPSIPSGQQGGGTTRDTTVQTSTAPSIVDGATESVSNTGGQAVSDPYTPAGSTMPQQTVFTLNADGSVTQSVVKRPDLVPHSAQAPTRYPVTPGTTATSPAPEHNIPTTPGTTTPAPTQPGQPTTPGTSQPGDTQTNDDNQNDFCKANPTAPQCTGEEVPSYEDLELPETQIDLSFEPADYFSTNGKCPAPRAVDLGMFGTVEFSYDPLCDFASKVRPIFILAVMVMCAWFVWASIEGKA